MPAAEVPSRTPTSIPDLDPPGVKSRSDNCGVTVEIYPPSTPDAIGRLPSNTISAANSPGIRSLKSSKSVESLPAIGAIPLGALRITEPSEEPELEPDTPLTSPDEAMEPSSNSRHAFPTGGDVLILDDLPADFTVGCDAMSFSTKEPFPGFRDIPPGAHLIWVAPSALTSSRSAYWIITPERKEGEPSEVYVKQWDNFNEILNDPASQAEERFQKEKLEQIFHSLSPYQLRTTSGVLLPPPTQESDHLPSFLRNDTIWSQLTSAINADLLNRITGKTQRSWQVTTQDSVAGQVTMAEEARLYARGKSQLRFLFPIDAPLISATASGEERTRQALDPTTFVLSVLENSTATQRPEDLVGELSFAFLTGMHLGNYACLEQWWFYATKLIFRSFSLAVVRPDLTHRLLRTFHAQLVFNDRFLEGDVLEMMPSHARVLQKALVTYKARLDEQLLALGDRISPAQHAVGAAFSDLEAWLWRLGWDLRGEYVRAGNLMLEDGEVVQAELSDFEDEDERGEFAPVVVQLDGGGRETGLVSWDR
ncbi:hypothetical protein F5Y04DRAFT_90203 [Hypomontagnella monticulosa]|nr:hypothetical protein F5Y04DRAFT_90203 [Hypomontagnella monticulosa]